MTRNIWTFITCGLLFSAAAVHAQSADIIISKGTDKTTIDASPFGASDPAGRMFIQVLTADLVRSGWFARGAQGASEYILSGSAGGGGGFVAQCRVAARGRSGTVFDRSYRGDANEVRRLAHEAADDILKALTGRDGMASARIALVGTLSGHKELYMADADGQGLVQLTGHKSVSITPSWHPDGDRLYYTSYAKGFPAIYELNLRGGSIDRVANYAGLNTGGVVSPDGRWMAMILSRDGNPELYVRRMPNGDPVRLTSTRRSAEASPTWSPDSRQIAFVSDMSGRPQVYVVGREGGQPRRLTLRGSENVSPDWGPNGLIAYSSRIGGRYQVCVLDPRSGDVKQITAPDADYEDPSWAPDSRHIAATRSIAYRSSVYLLDTLGDPPVALIDQKGDWTAPAWSPGR